MEAKLRGAAGNQDQKDAGNHKKKDADNPKKKDADNPKKKKTRITFSPLGALLAALEKFASDLSVNLTDRYFLVRRWPRGAIEDRRHLC